MHRYGAQGIDRTNKAQDLADQQWASGGSGMVTNGNKEILKQKRSRIGRYFLLVALLVIVILPVAGMTSCPFFMTYRQRYIRDAPIANLDYASMCQEGYYVDNETYADSIEILEEDCSSFQPSHGVVIYVVSADESHYKMEAYHLKGKYLYEVTLRDNSQTVIRYKWKNQVKGAGKVMK